MDRVVIIGSGAAGLSAAIRLAEENVPSFIVEEMPPWRAQSNICLLYTSPSPRDA